ncbi:D-alanine aminotransferase [hydrothermal vent metagenome]|uniref:D-alanine aminotransferase n=1 Tax=hydrothermal vent metagenome TaxID=652676 RepID=A0A3B1AN05_9ZZZZ
MTTQTVYLNGNFMPLNEAKVSVLDRGFIFGDAIYEVIPVFAGKLFRFEEHLQRLNNSLNSVKIKNPYSSQQWLSIFTDLIVKNNSETLSIYLQITRGVAPRNHIFSDNITPTVFIMATPLAPLNDSILENGVAIVTMDDIRWQYCQIKTTSLIANILLRQQASEQNAVEALLIKDGFVTEGAASNVFVIKDNIIFTPPKTNNVLPGITRDLVVELAQNNKLDIREQAIPQSALQSADEIWLTSSMKDILPVTTIDNSNVANGKPGPLWQKLHRAFNDYKDELCE